MSLNGQFVFTLSIDWRWWNPCWRQWWNLAWSIIDRTRISQL